MNKKYLVLGFIVGFLIGEGIYFALFYNPGEEHLSPKEPYNITSSGNINSSGDIDFEGFGDPGRLSITSSNNNGSILVLWNNQNNSEILRITYNGDVYHLGKYVGENESLPDLIADAFGIMLENRSREVEK